MISRREFLLEAAAATAAPTPLFDVGPYLPAANPKTTPMPTPVPQPETPEADRARSAAT